MPTFRIMRLHSVPPLKDELLPDCFDDPAAAKEAARLFNDGAKSLSQTTRFTVRKIAEDKGDEWRKREQHRFETGAYKYVPWHDALKAIKDHYVHISIDDPCLVSYTPDADHGAADRQMRTTPARYLKKFYDMSDPDIAGWSAKFMSADNKLLFAETADDIEWVYTHGPSSCMAGDADSYQTKGVHPSRVYAAGDLAVAYMQRGGRVTARVVCWPAKKIIGRVYGDVDRILVLLDKKGFYSGDLTGAKILKIPVARKSEQGTPYVCPYIDGLGCVTDKGDHFVLGGDYHAIGASNTDGCLYLPKMMKCPRCEGEYRDNDARSIRTSPDEPNLYWCRTCANAHSVICDHCGYRTPGETGTTVGGRSICQRCLTRYYRECSHCHTWRESTHCDTDADNGVVCDGCIRTEGLVVDRRGRYVVPTAVMTETERPGYMRATT